MQQRRPSFLGAVLALLVIGGILVWWVTSLTNGDPWWFLRSFTAQADWIVVYWDGQTYMFFPGDPGYDKIMEAFSDGVAHWVGYETGVGLSDENLARYRDEWRLLELHYNQPVLVHTRHLFPEARIFFVPLSGSHAKWHRVFSGLTDRPRIGVLNISETNFTSLIATVETMVNSHP